MLVILGEDGGSVSVTMIRGSEEGPSLLLVKALTDNRYLVNGAKKRKIRNISFPSHQTFQILKKFRLCWSDEWT